MRILWLCNFMPPAAARQLGQAYTNKEGWISGLLGMVMKKQRENAVLLATAFPVSLESGLIRKREEIFQDAVTVEKGTLYCYGFYEDSFRPEKYDEGLEERLGKIIRDFKPDIVHCFGTEYPHTLAMCRVFPKKKRLLIGIQGLCAVYANAYLAHLPRSVVGSVTLRDFLKRDSITRQQRKFIQRGRMEKEAVKLAGNVTGRTAWDRHYSSEWNPNAVYYSMNETLRENFYEGSWKEEFCIPHSIFLSQGDYPIKGLHYMLRALPFIKRKYPDVKVFVAGNNLTAYGTLKERLKISSYGKYLRSLIRQEGLDGQVEFLGKLNAEEMKERYLSSHLFVCCSTIENSPNSLGEAMLLGMPCVSADVGGIPSIFRNGEDGILYRGFRTSCNSFDRTGGEGTEDSEEVADKGEKGLSAVSRRLAEAVLEIWADREKAVQYCSSAREHAAKIHDREKNFRRLLDIYTNNMEGTL